MAIQAMDVRRILRQMSRIVAVARHVLISPMLFPVALEDSAVLHAIQGLEIVMAIRGMDVKRV